MKLPMKYNSLKSYLWRVWPVMTTKSTCMNYLGFKDGKQWIYRGNFRQLCYPQKQVRKLLQSLQKLDILWLVSLFHEEKKKCGYLNYILHHLIINMSFINVPITNLNIVRNNHHILEVLSALERGTPSQFWP